MHRGYAMPIPRCRAVSVPGNKVAVALDADELQVEFAAVQPFAQVVEIGEGQPICARRVSTQRGGFSKLDCCTLTANNARFDFVGYNFDCIPHAMHRALHREVLA